MVVRTGGASPEGKTQESSWCRQLVDPGLEPRETMGHPQFFRCKRKPESADTFSPGDPGHPPYGQSGGYSIGFKVLPKVGVFGERLTPEPNIYTCQWTKVVYEREKQKEICRSILDPILALLDETKTAQAMREVSNHPLYGVQKFCTAMMDILLEEIVRFKSKDFEVEKEWRAVVRRREVLKQGTDDGGKTPVPVYFRASRGMLVPYVKLVPWKRDERKKLPMKCIRSGPVLDKTMATVALSMMLQKNEFSGVRVQGSDITARF